MIQSIEEVIEKLEIVLQECIAKGSPLGYFPALYKRVTIQVRDAIASGSFEDNQRMETLDIIFASRYLDAYQAYQAGSDLSASWAAAFDAARNPKLITLQHLLVGMNAHISLDLGIAAAAAETQNPLTLKNDFNTINQILGDLIDDTQQRLTRIFGPLGILDKLLGSVDEKLSLYSIAYARDKAWTQTLELSYADQNTAKSMIAERDQAVARFAQKIIRPKKLSLRILLICIRLLEKGNVTDRLRILDA